MAVTAQSLPNDTFKPQADGLYNIGLNSPKTCLGENYGLPPAFERAKNQPSQDLASMGITTVHGQGEEAKSRYTSEHFHTWSKPPALWKPLRHPCCEEVSEEVDRYFLDNWKFPDNRAEKIFIKAGFSKVTSLYFPLAKNDRLHFACRLLTILFLVDGEFSHRLPRSTSPLFNYNRMGLKGIGYPAGVITTDQQEQMFWKTCLSQMAKPTTPDCSQSCVVKCSQIVSHG